MGAGVEIWTGARNSFVAAGVLIEPVPRPRSRPLTIRVKNLDSLGCQTTGSWRNWQTRQVEGLVQVNWVLVRIQSSPLKRLCTSWQPFASPGKTGVSILRRCCGASAWAVKNSPWTREIGVAATARFCSCKTSLRMNPECHRLARWPLGSAMAARFEASNAGSASTTAPSAYADFVVPVMERTFRPAAAKE